MVKTIQKITFRLLKITGITIGSILLLLYLIPVLFPGTIGEKIKTWANQSIQGEMNYSKVRLSFFNHFPSFTVSLYDFSLKGSAPFQKDTLLSAKEIAFGINLKNLIFDKHLSIDKVFLSNAYINVQVNEKGEANYNVYVGDTSSTHVDTNSDSSGTSLKLEEINISNSHLVYNDRSLELLMDAKGFNYVGNGDLSKAIFDLTSHAKIDSMNFYFAHEPYLLDKKIDADLITKMNTNSLAFFFEKNKLLINKLPVEFNGKLIFLKNGYDLDFTINSLSSNLSDVVTAMPPQYLSWQEKTTIKGNTDLLLTLKGLYIASTNEMPTLTFNMKIRDGYLKYEDAPNPVSNIFLNMESQLPALNTDSLSVKIDSLYFKVDKDYLVMVMQTKGWEKPFISGKINASLDLEKLDKAVGFQLVDLKGKLDLNGTMNGTYATGPNPISLRHEETITSIPVFKLQATLSNGYFKYDSLPQAISKINFIANASCADNDYKNTGFSIRNISAEALGNYIKGNIAVGSLKDMMVDAELQSNINLGEIKNSFPLDGLDLAGILKVNINAKGKYDEQSKKFPVTTAAIELNNGLVKTAYYPNPISKIEVKANALDNAGSLKTLEMKIQPVTFEFEGKPFRIEAWLRDFEDIQYVVKAKGELDLGRIYKVFSRKDLDVSGFIKADISLSGKQSDALRKQYSQLDNEGSLEFKDIKIHTEYLPMAFVINKGIFKFRKDKMWFNQFNASYGQSDFIMDGYLQNVIEYALVNDAVLKGNFKLQSNYLNVDEFTVFAEEKSSGSKPDSAVSVVAATESGVIIIPSNLDLTLDASFKKVSFSGLNIDSTKGQVSLKAGALSLKQTGFKLIGCEVMMDAAYKSISPQKASFNYHIDAKDFDIRRAYNEIKLFHDMASAAGKAQGIVSLDYNLKGKLDANMKPVYPSLEGGGVLSVKQVKVKGLKLLSAVSKQTGKDSIANPDVSKVDIKSKVKNNIITLEKFKIKMGGFRLSTEGQTSFDGQINFKMRLGLPPFGIIGIPMKITGTQEKPIIKMGKSDNNKLEEIEDTEEGTNNAGSN